MAKETQRAVLLRLCQQEHAALDAVLSTLTPERMDHPGLVGEWSVKQTLAHISWWERDVVSEVMRGEELDPGLNGEPWNTDRANALVTAASRDAPLADVLAAYQRSYAEVVRMLEELLGAHLDDEDTYAFIANNTAHHYHEHRELIEAGLAAHGGSARS